MFEDTNASNVRIYPEMTIEMERQHIDREPDVVQHYIVTPAVTVTVDEIHDLLRNWLEQFSTRLETVIGECPGSGYILTRIMYSVLFSLLRELPKSSAHISRLFPKYEAGDLYLIHQQLKTKVVS